ncbi:SMR family transporter [Oryzibacter oryziterrae]|uniref:SMR family transporter n=1 Tax=Oryzibacter oryziterrae TaxID=2766474 RepID=UPI001F022BD6|nr:SMR family transporter [Oryzibacter oryziterrae]
MRLADILLVILSVGLSSTSQIILKRGMTGTAVQEAMSSGRASDIAWTIGTAPLVWTGLFCFGLSAVVWLFVLSRIPLSQAYPFVSLGILVTVAAGFFVFNEPVGWQGVLGVGLIVAGVCLVGLRAA